MDHAGCRFPSSAGGWETACCKHLLVSQFCEGFIDTIACLVTRNRLFPFQGLKKSFYKVFTQVVPLFSIVTCGEFSRLNVKKTGAEVFSDALYVVTDFSLQSVTVKHLP